jgi:alpha-D-ribose 1-methylphosphonate 5-phosphate C-P lyase
MNNHKKTTCFTDIGDRAITSIILRIAKNELTKYFAQLAHLGINKLSLQATILKTQHLVEKLSKQLRVNNITNYQQHMPHPMKIDQIGK